MNSVDMNTENRWLVNLTCNQNSLVVVAPKLLQNSGHAYHN